MGSEKALDWSFQTFRPENYSGPGPAGSARPCITRQPFGMTGYPGHPVIQVHVAGLVL